MLDFQWALIELHLSNNQENLEKWLNLCAQLNFPHHLLDMVFIGIDKDYLSRHSTRIRSWYCITQC
jgi:hypothetical protein